MSKKVTAVDMTAMCDVAFLLLTFFILTATTKQPEILPVDTPSSTVQTKLPEGDLAMITIGGGNGTVFFGVSSPDVRKKTLELMSQKYGVKFSEEEANRFSLMESFGVPIQSLGSIINMKNADRMKANQPGIPKDSLDNQLADWIQNARIATISEHDKELSIAIKGDAKEEYPTIKRVMDILQDQKINSFNLVTGLRGDDF